MDKLWKATERAIARRLGGRRVPITGRQRGDVPDVAHPAFAVEVKTRRVLPQWLRDAVAQAVACQRSGQLPVAILHERGTRHADDLVVLRLADFEDWNGTVRRATGEETERRSTNCEFTVAPSFPVSNRTRAASDLVSTATRLERPA